MRVFFRSLLLLLGFFSVQIEADEKGNLARSGNATQSTTYNGQSPDLAIDGGKDFSTSSSSCGATNLGSEQWWRLDLQSVYQTNSVVVTYREDSFPGSSREITVFFRKTSEILWDLNTKCAMISSNAAAFTVTYSCGELEGQYITIFIWWGTISVCEVEVYEKVHIRRSFVKLAFKSSSSLTDPTVMEKVLKELTSALAVRGITNVKLSWSQTPQEEDKAAIPEADLQCN